MEEENVYESYDDDIDTNHIVEVGSDSDISSDSDE